MPRIFFVHWNESEAGTFAEPLIAAGFDVRTHWSSDQEYRWGDDQPDAVVISLDRLPSHGRAVAEWVWQAKKRQTIPIVFAGGVPDKVAATREKFPNAIYCSTADVPAVLGRAIQSGS